MYLGVAHKSPVGAHLGVIPNRDHFFAGVHLTANVLRRERWAIAWAPEVVPLLIVSDNPRYETTPLAGQRSRPDYFVTGAGPVYGFAVSPIGVEGQLRLSDRWRMYAAGAAGVVWFTRDVPVPGALSTDFTMEWGGGVIRQFGAGALRTGYKFHHLSNAYRSPQNPGLDGNVFLIGWQVTFVNRATLSQPEPEPEP
jgi:hypothetical protein